MANQMGEWSKRRAVEETNPGPEKMDREDPWRTGLLSGHGCFNAYLYKFRRIESDKCKYCNQPDDRDHTMFVCPRWEDYRLAFMNKTGKTFNARSMMDELMESPEGWSRAYGVVKNILEEKIRDE